MLTAKQYNFLMEHVYLRVDLTTFTHIITVNLANFPKIPAKCFLSISSLKLTRLKVSKLILLNNLSSQP